MDRSLALFAIGLVFGGGIGFVVAAGNGITFDGHDHTVPAAHGATQMDHAAMGHGDMDHEMMHDTPVDVPAENAPSVAMMLKPDPMAGYNLRVTVDNFAFSPEGASLAHAPGKGHAHVYINGVKIARVYGPWLHIENFPVEGPANLRVTLNANDHSGWSVNGEPLAYDADFK